MSGQRIPVLDEDLSTDELLTFNRRREEGLATRQQSFIPTNAAPASNASGNVSVRFREACGVYQPLEVAGFTEAEAARLVALGVAVRL